MLRRFGDGILILLVLIMGAAWLLGRVNDRSDPRLPSKPSETFVVPAPDSIEEKEKGPILPAPSPFDDQSMVEAQRAGPWSSGTGFAIGDNGVWAFFASISIGMEQSICQTIHG